tara:strand:- start:387 stop:695 length:309 start_codon:yes stop_codon:yes gene_type:complete
MPIERQAKSEKIAKMKVIAKEYKNDYQKVNFFDNHMAAFFSFSNTTDESRNENISKDVDDAFYIYANMKRMTEKEFEKFKELKWNEYPRNFKIFLFDYCILN